MDYFDSMLEGYDESWFEEIAIAFSADKEIESGEQQCIGENAVEKEAVSVSEIPAEALTQAELLSSLEEIFQQYTMPEHLASVRLLGDLSYTDVLMYYCLVRDGVFLREKAETEEAPTELVTPEQYVAEKEKAAERECSFVFETEETKLKKLMEVLKYLRNKEFRILSNTFYMDGSDFILFLCLKSVVGYNLRIKIVYKCDSETAATALQTGFEELQRKMNGGERNE